MEEKYLLDTNILSYAIKNPQGSISEHINTKPASSISTSIIVACELRYGIALRKSKKLSNRVNALLSEIEILPIDINVDEHYGDIRATLEKKGKIIGLNDLLIAAHARSLDRILVTNNLNEFKRVPGLRVENWV